MIIPPFNGACLLMTCCNRNLQTAPKMTLGIITHNKDVWKILEVFFTDAAVHPCVWHIKYWFHLQGAHGQFHLAQERDSEWLMPTVRMTWGRIIYSPGAKRFDSKLNDLPEFLIAASLNVSVFFNRSNGYESSKGCRSKKKVIFLFCFWEIQELHCYTVTTLTRV